jgi:hypothetical protein
MFEFFALETTLLTMWEPKLWNEHRLFLTFESCTCKVVLRSAFFTQKLLFPAWKYWT